MRSKIAAMAFLGVERLKYLFSNEEFAQLVLKRSSPEAEQVCRLLVIMFAYVCCNIVRVGDTFSDLGLLYGL